MDAAADQPRPLFVGGDLQRRHWACSIHLGELEWPNLSRLCFSRGALWRPMASRWEDLIKAE